VSLHTIDRTHLEAEHRAAVAELRRLRSENQDLREQLDALEQENQLAHERADELEAQLIEESRAR